MIKHGIVTADGRGARQEERFPKALDPSTVELDGRRFEDLFQMFIGLSEKIKYYGSDSKAPSGDWKAFFAAVTDSDGRFDPVRFGELESRGEMPAHLSLMAAFFKMYDVERQNLNLLTARHLDHFYRDILGFFPRVGRAGNVPVCIELNKNAKSALIPAGSRFIAGKDAEGKAITYFTEEDFVAYPAKVGEMHSIDMDPGAYPSFGWALAVPALALKGEKLIVRLRDSEILSLLSAEYTTETGWAECPLSGASITLSDPLPAPYDESVHQAHIPAASPVIRFVVKGPILAGSLSDVAIEEVEVVKSTDFHFRSSRFGIVRNVAGAMPFGPAPRAKDKAHFVVPSVKGCLRAVVGDCDWKSARFGMDDGKNSLSLLNDCGQDDYLKGLINFSRDSDQKALPDKPDIPVLSSPAKISYTVTLAEDDGADVFTFSPFGIMAGGQLPEEAGSDHYCRHVYLGIEGARPDTSLSLLLSVSHPSAYEPAPEIPQWAFLSGNTWKKVVPLKDSTDNLLKSGILRFDLSDPALFEPHSIMPCDKLWLRVSFPVLVGSAEIGSAVAQAVELVPDPLSAGVHQKGAALPPGSVIKPLYAIAGVKKVLQPLAGFEGEFDESERGFMVRVSERIRHKDRCVTTWDYERMLLEAFPSLSMVRCLHSVSAAGRRKVEVVVVPKMHEKGDLAPVVSLAQKMEMERLLTSKSSVFSDISVVDPIYEPVSVSCEISLMPGLADVKEYSARIAGSLASYLAPWAGGDEDVDVDYSTSESSILFFLEKLPYVDNVRNLAVMVGGNRLLEGEEARPSSRKAVLTAGTMSIIVNPNSNG